MTAITVNLLILPLQQCSLYGIKNGNGCEWRSAQASGMKWLWPILRCYLDNYFEETCNFSLQTGI